MPPLNNIVWLIVGLLAILALCVYLGFIQVNP